MKPLLKTSLCATFISVLFINADARPQRHGTPLAKKSLAAQCAADLERAGKRIFGNPGGKVWKEYANVKLVPELDGTVGEVLIVIKTSSSGRHYVDVVDYGEDSASYLSNFYGSGGALSSMHYEMRTAWGWGYEELTRFAPAGKLVTRSTRFFETAHNRQIKRPDGADDVPDFLKPTIYKTFSALPIIGVFEQGAHATP